jgi:hypothetical protein
LNRKVQFQGLAFLKIKEFTSVSDCFQKGRNAEIGLFGQALLNSYGIGHITKTIPTSTTIQEISFSIDETIQSNNILTEIAQSDSELSLKKDEIEKNLTLETWMTNDDLFKTKPIKNHKEETLPIEKWMTDSKSWKL